MARAHPRRPNVLLHASCGRRAFAEAVAASRARYCRLDAYVTKKHPIYTPSLRHKLAGRDSCWNRTTRAAKLKRRHRRPSQCRHSLRDCETPQIAAATARHQRPLAATLASDASAQLPAPYAIAAPKHKMPSRREPQPARHDAAGAVTVTIADGDALKEADRAVRRYDSEGLHEGPVCGRSVGREHAQTTHGSLGSGRRLVQVGRLLRGRTMRALDSNDSNYKACEITCSPKSRA